MKKKQEGITLYSTNEVAVMLGVSPRRVRVLAKEYAMRVGRPYVWTAEAIENARKHKGKIGRPPKNKTEECSTKRNEHEHDKKN